MFTDGKGNGIIGKIIDNKTNELISIKYDGLLMKGREDYESNEAKNISGGRETYRLSEKNGNTYLSIESDMTEEYFDILSSRWEKALQKVKELSENNR